MTEKIKELIKSSRAIKDADKALYSKMAEFLDETGQKQLLDILQKELTEAQKIEKEANAEKLAINKDFTVRLNTFFKTEQAKAIKSEEQEESVAGEDILKKLNDE